MKTLYINSCTRENSRTKILADYLLQKINTDVKEIILNEEKTFDEKIIKEKS